MARQLLSYIKERVSLLKIMNNFIKSIFIKINLFIKKENINNFFLDEVKEGNLESVMFLINYVKLNPSFFYNKGFQLAVLNQHLSIVKFLSNHQQVNVSDCDNLALTQAVDLGNLDIVNFILKSKSFNPYFSHFAILSSIENKNKEIFLAISSSQKINLSFDNNYILKRYCNDNFIDFIEPIICNQNIISSISINQNYIDIINSIIENKQKLTAKSFLRNHFFTKYAKSNFPKKYIELTSFVNQNNLGQNHYAKKH